MFLYSCLHKKHKRRRRKREKSIWPHLEINVTPLHSATVKLLSLLYFFCPTAFHLCTITTQALHWLQRCWDHWKNPADLSTHSSFYVQLWSIRGVVRPSLLLPAPAGAQNACTRLSRSKSERWHSEQRKVCMWIFTLHRRNVELRHRTCLNCVMRQYRNNFQM